MKSPNWKLSIADYFIAQALSQSTIVFILTLSAVYGLLMTGEESLATIPLGTQVLGVFTGLIPAAAIMKRLGRKRGFQIGALVGLFGAFLAVFAVRSGNFGLFVVSHFFIGLQQGCYQYLRFAASETMPADKKSVGISLVLAGGVVAAFLGPSLASWVRNITPDSTNPYAYWVLVALLSLLFIVISFQNRGEKIPADRKQSGRPLREILRVPRFWVALSASGTGLALMILFMTATPLSMRFHGHSGLQSAIVIQWHVLGMFVPSFFSGWLIKRFGALKIILLGWFLMIAEIIIASLSISYFGYWASLFLLGISWNFLFVGGSTWLTGVYRPEEREKTQAAHDMLAYMLSTIATYSSAPLLSRLGWQNMQLTFMPLVVVATVFFGLVLFRNLRPKYPNTSGNG